MSASLLKEAALFISLTPIIISISKILFPSLTTAKSIPIPLWLFWGASVAFVFAWALLYIAGPKFVREYRDFGQYAARQHSHRWIVWEFYNNLKSLSGWENVVRETSPKGLAIEIHHLSKEVLEQLGADFAAPATEKLQVFRPVNIDRDIYLPMHVDGEKVVLPMLEKDPELREKEKELFWILYTQAAKEKPFWRTVFWILMGVAVLLVSFNIIRKIYLVVNGAMS
jgi:hypothetical protein